MYQVEVCLRLITGGDLNCDVISWIKQHPEKNIYILKHIISVWKRVKKAHKILLG
jgi:hypothetical protein